MAIQVPIIIAGFTTWLAASIPGIVARVLGALGLGIVSFTGADLVVTEFENFYLATLGQLPVAALQIFQLAGLDTGVKMVIAAWTTHFGLKVAMGAFRRFGEVSS